MTPEFIPDPYQNFAAMRRAVYNHLYPEPKDDQQLLDTIRERVDAAKKTEITPESSPTPLTPEQQKLARRRKLQLEGARDIGYVERPKPKSKPKIERRNLALERETAILDSIENGSFEPVSSFFPPEDRNSVKLLIGQLRWMRFTQVVRKHLYQGKLNAYYKSLDGIIPVPNRNIWLIDEVSISALTTGRVAPLVELPDHIVDMIFNGEEMANLFPLFGSNATNAGENSASSQVLEAIVAALQETFPNGIPDNMAVKDAMSVIQENIGYRIGRTTFFEARKVAYPDV